MSTPTTADATPCADLPAHTSWLAIQVVSNDAGFPAGRFTKVADSAEGICKTRAVPDVAYIHGTDPVEQNRLAELNRLTNASFIQFLNLPLDAAVLEVGSGLGLLAAEVAARVPLGSVVGLEYSVEQLAKTCVTLPNLRFEQGDAHHLPFPAAQFDIVYCRYLLEHVADPVKVLREMRRVLVAGGNIFVQENNILTNELWPECQRFDAVWRKFAELQARLGGDALIGKKLFALLRQAGFQNVTLSIAPELHAAGSATFVPWIENLIQNVRGAAANLDAHNLANASQVEEALAELKAFEDLPHACAHFYWNRATATKTEAV